MQMHMERMPINPQKVEEGLVVIPQIGSVISIGVLEAMTRTRCVYAITIQRLGGPRYRITEPIGRMNDLA